MKEVPLTNNHPSTKSSDVERKIERQTFPSKQGERTSKKKQNKASSKSKINLNESSEPQQGVLGYMTHHRWGKTATNPIKLESLPLECRQWVVKLSPVLDMFDYDCQDILDLIETCGYEEARIEATVDAIFRERAGHERGQWQPGRRSTGVHVQKNNTTVSNSFQNDKPGSSQRKQVSPEKNNTGTKNKGFRNRRNTNESRQKTKGSSSLKTPNALSRKGKEPVMKSILEKASEVPSITLKQSNELLSGSSVEPKNDTVPKTSWASIVVANLPGTKGKELKTSHDETGSTQTSTHESKSESNREDVKNESQQESSKLSESYITLREEKVPSTQENSCDKETLSKSCHITNGTPLSFETKNAVYETQRASVKGSENALDLKELSQKNVPIGGQVAFTSSHLSKEAPPGLHPSSTREEMAVKTVETASLCGIPNLETQESSPSESKAPRTEQVPSNEGFNFYLGSVRRTQPFTLLADKVPVSSNESSLTSHPEKTDADRLSFDPLRNYREDSLYGHRRMPYPNQALWHQIAFKETQMPRNSVPRGTQPTLLYSPNGNQSLGYSRDINRPMLDGSFEMRQTPDVYESSSVYPPMHPSYVAPFHIQQHRAVEINSMSRYPIQYHAYNAPASRPADFYPYHVDRSMIEGQTPHYPLDSKQGNISVFPYNFNNSMVSSVDYRAPHARAMAPPSSAGPVGLNDIVPSDIQQRAYQDYRQSFSRHGVPVYTGAPSIASTLNYANPGHPPAALHAVPPLESHDLGGTKDSLRWRSQGGTTFDPSLMQMPYQGFHVEKQYDPYLVSYDHQSFCYENQSSVALTSSSNAQGPSETLKCNVTNTEHLRDCVAPQNYVSAPVSNYFVDRSNPMTQGPVTNSSGRSHLEGYPIYHPSSQTAPFNAYHDSNSASNPVMKQG